MRNGQDFLSNEEINYWTKRVQMSYSTTTCINKQPCYFFLFMYIIDISNIPTIHDENVSILEYTYINITIENLVNPVPDLEQAQTCGRAMRYQISLS